MSRALKNRPTASLPQQLPCLNWPRPGFASASLLSKTVQKLLQDDQMASTWPWLNSWESWLQSPTSSQELGS